MKKLLSIMLVVLIASSLAFAEVHNINLGVGGVLESTKVAKPARTFPDRFMKDASIDLELGYNVEFDNGLVLYENLGFGYVLSLSGKGKGDYGWNTNDQWLSIYPDNKKFVFLESTGAGYAFHFDNFRVITGGGFHFGMIISDIPFKDFYINFIGINLLAQGEYAFNEHFSAFVSLRPNANLISIFKLPTLECSDFATGLSTSAVIGASYKF